MQYRQMQRGCGDITYIAQLSSLSQVEYMTGIAGATIFPELQKTVIFLNQDLNATGLQSENEIFYDIDCFGIRGRSQQGDLIGLTVGVNHYGLAACNSHVYTTEDPSYHLLTEQILMFAKDAEDGLGMTMDHLKSGRRYQWGNIVLADHDSIVAIEIAGDQHSVEWSERRVLRASHHFMLDTEGVLRRYYETQGIDELEYSNRRTERGYELLRHASDIKDIFNLLKDHGDQPGPMSLCRHSSSPQQPQTVMSYVIEVDHRQETTRPRMLFHVAKGRPCQTEYTTIPLLFPADEEVIKRAIEVYRAAK